MGSTSAMQGTALIGHNVLVSGDTFSNSGSGVSGAFDVAAPGTVVVNITDANGAVVRHMSTQSNASGSMSYAWDGKTDSGDAAADGTYHVSATLDAGQASIALQTQINAPVESISLSATGLILNLGGLGATPLSSVININ